MSSIVQRVRTAVADWLRPQSVDKTTTKGFADPETQFERWGYAFQYPDGSRMKVYDDVDDMDATVDEVSAGLDVLADNTVHGDKGERRTFEIVYEVGSTIPDEVKRVIEETIVRTRWEGKAHQITRDLLKYGDVFLERIINSDLIIERLMYLPPESMYRNEDRSGLLLDKDSAFVQKNPDTFEVIASFFPWQIQHIRWNPSGGSKYGRSLLATARTAWLKLRAMEEALVINWLTRAFARLLFILDVTDKTPNQTKQYLDMFKKSLQTQRVGPEGSTATNLSVVKDVYIGKRYHKFPEEIREGLSDVKVLDTSNSAYLNLSALEYYRGKILTSMRVPKAHLGLEKDINAKATLQLQDKRFAKTVRRIQTVLSEAIMDTVDLQLALMGFDPNEIPYALSWPSAGWTDEVDSSLYYKNIGDFADTAIALGLVDSEYVATKLLRVSPQEWEAIRARIEEQGDALQKGDDADEAPGEGDTAAVR